MEAVAKALNKPYMTDEAGVEAGTCSSSASNNGASGHGLTFAGRVTYLENKANDYFQDGSSGIDFWDYEQTAGSSCSYEFLPSDPMVTAVEDYSVPS